MKVIPKMYVSKCQDCLPFYRPNTGGKHCWHTDMKESRVNHILINGIHPDCPLADAVSDPCHFYPEAIISCGVFRKSLNDPGDACRLRTWSTCPYGKEWMRCENRGTQDISTVDL
jgi:hypothetical protein